MRLTSTFVLLSAAAAFSAKGVNITVNATVDSRLESVTLTAKLSSGSTQTMGPVSKNGSETWTAWSIGTAYTSTVTGEPTGYSARWKVIVDGEEKMSGGVDSSITLQQSHAGCTLSFYAAPNAYTITLDQQFGSGGTASANATFDAAMPSIKPPTRPGYEFCSYTNSAGVAYYNADGTSARTWDKASGITLYAQWRATTQRVTFDMQLGSGGTTSTTATYDAAMPAITPPTRPGYEFCSYTTAPNGGGTQYYNADGTSAHTWDIASDTTLYANWTVITSTVTLNPQGGSGGSTSVTATYASPMPPITLPSRTGYKFHAYFSEPEGVGTRYYNAKGASARKWDQTSNTTLYAHWVPPPPDDPSPPPPDDPEPPSTYMVTLDPQGGSGGTESVTATNGIAMPAIIPPSLDGYEFCSYTNSTGVAYYNADGTSAHEWDIASDTTLYASWKLVRVPGNLAVAVDAPELDFETFGTVGPQGRWDEDRTNFNWFVQTDFKYYGTNAVQSGALPEPGEYIYASWLTTEVRGKGVLSFWWKCAAADRYKEIDEYEPANNVDTGDALYFGQYDADGLFTPLTERLEGNVEWVQVVYTNECEDAVTFAWKFQFDDYKGYGARGGGTGWVDRVEWIPDEPPQDPDDTQLVCTVKFDAQGGTATETERAVTNGYAVGTLPTATRAGYRGGDWYTVSEGGSKVSASTVITNDVTFYARWSAESFTVYFNWNHFADDTRGGSLTWTYGSSLTSTLSRAARERDGYDFLGYFTAREGGTQYINEDGTSATWNIPSNTTLYAHWKPIQYSISFDANAVGVVNTMDTIDCTYDLPTNLTSCAFERTGYGFAGWTNSVGTTFADGAVVSNLTKTVNETVTLYAKWTAKTYTVSFDDGSGAASSSITYGESVVVPSREGYAFGGYFTEPKGGGTKCYNADGSMVESVAEATISGTTLYAYWMANSYTLSFNSAGGSSVDPITLPCGTTITAPVAPTKEGYSFAGWNPALPTTMPAEDKMVTAQWTINQYTLTFNTDGGSEIASIKQDYNTTITAPANPTKTGYTFAGWNPAVPTKMPAENKTVTAQWTPNTYTVTFKPNGGTGDEYSMACTYDAPTNLTPCAFMRTGYGFAGWTTNGADSVVFENGADISNLTADAGGTMTLYALWTANPYTISFNANGGSGGSMADQSFTYDTGAALASNAYTRTGYTFAGWATNEYGSGVIYGDGVDVLNLAAEGTTTLYAIWKGVGYSIVFDGNNYDAGTMSKVACTYGVPTNLPPCKFVRDGYGFAGWTTNDASGVVFADEARVSNLTAEAGAEFSLIACWTGITYAVTLDALDTSGNDYNGVLTNAAGEVVHVVTNNYTVGDDWNLPSITNVNEHLDFDGWAYKGTTTLVSGQVPPPSEGTELTALWTPKQYEVTLDQQDGSNGTVSVTATWGESMPAADMPMREGYAFGGYFEEPNGGGKQYYDENGASANNWDMAADTLYAKWTSQNPLVAALDEPEGLEFSNFSTFGATGNENTTNLDWFVQSDTKYHGETAVQSGALPTSGFDSYISWLTTKMPGKSILSFWWKCEIDEWCEYYNTLNGTDKEYVGDAMYFGLRNADGSFTPLTERLEGNVEWVQVVYTNELDTAVNIAWKFQYEPASSDDYQPVGGAFGGGTGWVDRVEWKQLP